jgi:hypothetical protein
LITDRQVTAQQYPEQRNRSSDHVANQAHRPPLSSMTAITAPISASRTKKRSTRPCRSAQ